MVSTQANMQITPNINEWLANGERGISSEAIVSHLTGINVGSRHWFSNHPSDPDDLRRCALLIKSAPEIRAELHRMGEVSEVWKKLVAEWDELVALMWTEAATKNKRAPECYERMKALGC